MKEIEFDVVEIIDDKYGHRLKHSKRVETYTDEQVRHNDLCTVCGFPSYPECREWCQNEQWAREKAQRNKTEEIKDTTKEVKDKTREVKAGCRYKHFKGFEAVVITVGTHTETGEKMVVYPHKKQIIMICFL